MSDVSGPRRESSEEPSVELRIEQLLGGGQRQAAATLSVEAYGSEVFGFLVSLMRDADAASEVFSQACEDLWAGLPGFEGRSSLRTWFYTLARNAASRFHRSPQRDRRRHVPLSQMAELAEATRTRTLPHLRTDVKDQFAVIRDSLDESDRALLVLRVDRQMSWNDIARILAGDGGAAEPRTRASARLRKRFQVLKEELRQRALAAGLLGEDEP
jgi:RNA polymerase sigma-70 factor (ECF subfamily)